MQRGSERSGNHTVEWSDNSLNDLEAVNNSKLLSYSPAAADDDVISRKRKNNSSKCPFLVVAAVVLELSAASI